VKGKLIISRRHYLRFVSESGVAMDEGHMPENESHSLQWDRRLMKENTYI
jgi:hypothetical protein